MGADHARHREPQTRSRAESQSASAASQGGQDALPLAPRIGRLRPYPPERMVRRASRPTSGISLRAYQQHLSEADAPTRVEAGTCSDHRLCPARKGAASRADMRGTRAPWGHAKGGPVEVAHHGSGASSCPTGRVAEVLPPDRAGEPDAKPPQVHTVVSHQASDKGADKDAPPAREAFRSCSPLPEWVMRISGILHRTSREAEGG